MANITPIATRSPACPTSIPYICPGSSYCCQYPALCEGADGLVLAGMSKMCDPVLTPTVVEDEFEFHTTVGTTVTAPGETRIHTVEIGRSESGSGPAPGVVAAVVVVVVVVVASVGGLAWWCLCRRRRRREEGFLRGGGRGGGQEMKAVAEADGRPMDVAEVEGRGLYALQIGERGG